MNDRRASLNAQMRFRRAWDLLICYEQPPTVISVEAVVERDADAAAAIAGRTVRAFVVALSSAKVTYPRDPNNGTMRTFRLTEEDSSNVVLELVPLAVA